MNTATSERLLTAALRAAQNGYYVFPLRPGGKRPAIRRWAAVATRDPNAIRVRWQSSPFNIGIACGASRLYVLDLDDAQGRRPPRQWAGARNGQDVLARLAAAAGEPYPPDTYTVTTPNGGLHLYFRPPTQPELRNTVGQLGWCIDTRGVGGYIVAAGSVCPQGRYRAGKQTAIAWLPPWLVSRLRPPPRPKPIQFPPRRSPQTVDEYWRIDAYVKAVAQNVARARPGHRHNTLLRAAYTLGRLVAGDELSKEHARAALNQAAAHHEGVQGWTSDEATRTITDGLAAGARFPRRITTSR